MCVYIYIHTYIYICKVVILNTYVVVINLLFTLLLNLQTIRYFLQLFTQKMLVIEHKLH